MKNKWLLALKNRIFYKERRDLNIYGWVSTFFMLLFFCISTYLGDLDHCKYGIIFIVCIIMRVLIIVFYSFVDMYIYRKLKLKKKESIQKIQRVVGSLKKKLPTYKHKDMYLILHIFIDLLRYPIKISLGVLGLSWKKALYKMLILLTIFCLIGNNWMFYLMWILVVNICGMYGLKVWDVKKSEFEHDYRENGRSLHRMKKKTVKEYMEGIYKLDELKMLSKVNIIFYNHRVFYNIVKIKMYWKIIAERMEIMFKYRYKYIRKKEYIMILIISKTIIEGYFSFLMLSLEHTTREVYGEEKVFKKVYENYKVDLQFFLQMYHQHVIWGNKYWEMSLAESYILPYNGWYDKDGDRVKFRLLELFFGFLFTEFYKLPKEGSGDGALDNAFLWMNKIFEGEEKTFWNYLNFIFFDPRSELNLGINVVNIKFMLSFENQWRKLWKDMEEEFDKFIEDLPIEEIERKGLEKKLSTLSEEQRYKYSWWGYKGHLTEGLVGLFSFFSRFKDKIKGSVRLQIIVEEDFERVNDEYFRTMFGEDSFNLNKIKDLEGKRDKGLEKIKKKWWFIQMYNYFDYRIGMCRESCVKYDRNFGYYEVESKLGKKKKKRSCRGLWKKLIKY